MIFIVLHTYFWISEYKSMFDHGSEGLILNLYPLSILNHQKPDEANKKHRAFIDLKS